MATPGHCVEDRLTRQVLRIDQIVERLRMKLNRSRRDAWILEAIRRPNAAASERGGGAQGALGLLGSVSIAHIECLSAVLAG